MNATNPDPVMTLADSLAELMPQYRRLDEAVVHTPEDEAAFNAIQGKALAIEDRMARIEATTAEGAPAPWAASEKRNFCRARMGRQPSATYQQSPKSQRFCGTAPHLS